MPTFSHDWFVGSERHWTDALQHLIGTPAVGVEIGSFEGRSAIWLCEHIFTHPDARLYCIDPWQPMPNAPPDFDYVRAEERFDQNTAGYVQIRKHKGDIITAMYWLDYIPLDFAYIDGSHEARDIVTDFTHIFPLLKTGGVLIFDDYSWDAFPQHRYPKTAIDFILDAWGDLITREFHRDQVVVRKT